MFTLGLLYSEMENKEPQGLPSRVAVVEQPDDDLSASGAAALSIQNPKRIQDYYWCGYCDVPTPGNEDTSDFLNMTKNDLLLHTLLGFMDVKSMKMLGSTCHWLYATIRRKRGFQNRTKLNITQAFLDRMKTEIEPAGNEDNPPKNRLQAFIPTRNYLIDLSKDWKTVSIVPYIALLPSPQYLEMKISANFLDQRNPCCQEKNLLLILERIGGGLKHLVLIGEEYTRTGRDEISEYLKNLRSLESLTVRNPGSGFGHRNTVSRAIFDLQKSLKSLSVRPLNDEGVGRLRAGFIPSLKSLDMSTEIWLTGTGDAFKVVDLPSLEHLSVRTVGHNIAIVTRLIHPLYLSLKSLSLIFLGITSNYDHLQALLRTRGYPNLKKLKIDWKINTGGNEHRIDWSFLRDWTQLEDVEIHQIHFQAAPPCELVIQNHAIDEYTFGSIITSLPDSAKRIVISGALSGIWVGDTPQLMKDNIQRFRNLCILDIFRCRNALTDDILAFISTEFPHLKELGFSHCDGITDIGIVRRKTGDGTCILGLSAFTRLRKLKIADCSYLTLGGYMRSLSFPHLNRLTLLINSVALKIHPAFYVDIIIQNKWLQSLHIFDKLNLKHRMKQYVLLGFKFIGIPNASYTITKWKSVEWSNSLRERLPVTFSKLIVQSALPSVIESQYYSDDDDHDQSIDYGNNGRFQEHHNYDEDGEQRYDANFDEDGDQALPADENCVDNDNDTWQKPL